MDKEQKQIKKILVVAESIDVEDSSGTKGRVALIKNLCKAGFELQVYHYTRKNIELAGISCHSIKENRKSLLFFLSRLERYIRYWLKISPNRYIENLFGFSFTFFNDSNSIADGLKKMSDFEPDLVLTLSKGASFRPHHALLQIPEWHSKWMAYIHDPYPFSCYPRPYDYVEPGHQQKKEFLLQVAKKSKYAAFPSKLLAEWMESYYKALNSKTVILPHQIEKEYSYAGSLPDFFNIKKFNLIHAGNLIWGRNPMGLIDGFLLFLKNNPEVGQDAKLLLIGGRNHYSKELEKISKQNPEIFVSENYFPFNVTQNLQKNAAVNIILEAVGPISPFLPGKFPHCIAAGKPILLLGPYYSESRRLLGKDYPYWSEANKPLAIAAQIEKLYFKWKEGNVQYDFNKEREYLSVKNLANQLQRMV